MLQLGRYAKWGRSDIRGMTPAEFAGYMQAANQLIEDDNGA